MTDREENRRLNDALQSSQDELAYGEDAREFGEDGQTVERAFDTGHNDKPDRKLGRDPTVPPFEHPDRSKR